MIEALFSIGLLLSLCHAQTSTDPVAPEIIVLENQETGIYIQWEIASSQPVFTQRIVYTDALGRSREQSAGASQRLTYLYFVQPCMHYSVQVITTFSTGKKMESEVKEITRSEIPIPPTPIDLTIVEHEDGFILRWNMPETDAQISKFNIIGREDGGEIVHQSVQYDQTEAVLSAFHLHHSYDVTMTSENSCGVSEESEPVRLLELQAPGQPQIISTFPLLKAIKVEFAKNADDVRVDTFHLNYTTPNGILSVSPISGSTTTVTLSEDIEACVKYEISLWAVNAMGQSEVATTSAYAFSIDAARTPTNVAVTDSNGQIELSWESQSTSDLLSHELVYESTSGETTEESVDGQSTTAVLNNVKRCESYKLRMRAESKCGYSAWTSWTDFKVDPQEKPTRPMDLSASGTADHVTLTWKAAEASSYLEYYDILVVNLASSAVTFWAPPTATEFNLRNLTPGGSYAISMRSTNACGWSEPIDLFIELTAAGDVRPLALNSKTVSLLKRARRAAMAN